VKKVDWLEPELNAGGVAWDAEGQIVNE